MSADKELLDTVQEQIQECIPEYNNEAFRELGLSPQEILFTYLNVKYANATKAYEEAFGVEYKVALTKGKKLEKEQRIKEATMTLYDEIWEEAVHALPIMLMRELESVRSLNIASYMNGDRFKNPEELTEEQQRLIEGITFQVNARTGETLLVYQFPSKSAVYSKYLDLIKLYKESNVDKEKQNTDREAAEMVKGIFANVKTES